MAPLSRRLLGFANRYQPMMTSVSQHLVLTPQGRSQLAPKALRAHTTLQQSMCRSGKNTSICIRSITRHPYLWGSSCTARS